VSQKEEFGKLEHSLQFSLQHQLSIILRTRALILSLVMVGVWLSNYGVNLIKGTRSSLGR
jgi:hypothetical protein